MSRADHIPEDDELEDGLPAPDPDGVAGDPAAGDSARGDSARGDSARGDPAAGDPAAGDPAAGDPAAGDPAEASPTDEDLLPTSEEGENPSDVEALRRRAAEADQFEARLKRVEADFVNESKRLKRLAENDRKYAIEKVVVDLLPIVDAVHSAGHGLGDSEPEQRMREGLELVRRQLMETLARHGVEPIEAEGAFDPNRHEALFTVPRDDLPAQTIVDVMRPGFLLHGRVVRPAEVAVSTAAGGGGSASPENEDE